jgi:hypothetical protein
MDFQENSRLHAVHSMQSHGIQEHSADAYRSVDAEFNQDMQRLAQILGLPLCRVYCHSDPKLVLIHKLSGINRQLDPFSDRTRRLLGDDPSMTTRSVHSDLLLQLKLMNGLISPPSSPLSSLFNKTEKWENLQFVLDFSSPPCPLSQHLMAYFLTSFQQLGLDPHFPLFDMNRTIKKPRWISTLDPILYHQARAALHELHQKAIRVGSSLVASHSACEQILMSELLSGEQKLKELNFFKQNRDDRISIFDQEFELLDQYALGQELVCAATDLCVMPNGRTVHLDLSEGAKVAAQVDLPTACIIWIQGSAPGKRVHARMQVTTTLEWVRPMLYDRVGLDYQINRVEIMLQQLSNQLGSIRESKGKENSMGPNVMARPQHYLAYLLRIPPADKVPLFVVPIYRALRNQRYNLSYEGNISTQSSAAGAPDSTVVISGTRLPVTPDSTPIIPSRNRPSSPIPSVAKSISPCPSPKPTKTSKRPYRRRSGYCLRNLENQAESGEERERLEENSPQSFPSPLTPFPNASPAKTRSKVVLPRLSTPIDRASDSDSNQSSSVGKAACPVCGRRFRRRYDRDRHISVHTKDKRYMCLHCPRSYTRHDVLMNHMRRCLHRPKENTAEASTRRNADSASPVKSASRGIRKRNALSSLPLKNHQGENSKRKTSKISVTSTSSCSLGIRRVAPGKPQNRIDVGTSSSNNSTPTSDSGMQESVRTRKRKKIRKQ